LFLRLRSPRTSAYWTADYRTITNHTIAWRSIGSRTIARHTIARHTIARRTIACRTIARRTITCRISAYWTAGRRTVTNRAIARRIIAYRNIAHLGLAQCGLAHCGLAHCGLARRSIGHAIRSIGRAIGCIRARRSAIRGGGVPTCRHTRPGNPRPAPKNPRPRLGRFRGLGVARLAEQFAEHNTQMNERLPQILRGSIAPLGVSADLLGRTVVAQRGSMCHGQVRPDLVGVLGRIPSLLHDRRQQTLAINNRMQRLVNETLLHGPPFSGVLGPRAGAQWPDTEALHTPFPPGQFRCGPELAALLPHDPVVLGAEALLKTAARHGHRKEHQHHDGDHHDDRDGCG
jgi:hypothetical protein